MSYEFFLQVGKKIIFVSFSYIQGSVWLLTKLGLKVGTTSKNQGHIRNELNFN